MPVVLRFGEVKLGYSRLNTTTSYLREKVLWSSADRVAAVSGAVGKDLVKHYGIPSEKVRVTYNGIDPELFKPVQGAAIPHHPELEGKKVVLYVGHFGLRKGLIHLIGAMGQVAREAPGSVLVCVGGVPDWLGGGKYWEYLRLLIDRNNLQGKVFLLDKVPNSELPLYYSACSVFVLPSYYEAFAKVVLEAMACARPVVISKEGGPREAIQGDSPAGLLVSYGSRKELADSIITILQNEALAEEMGLNGRKRVLTDFTWEKVSQRMDSMYAEVLGY